MALELYMLGLIVEDMSRSLEFYRRLGLTIPAGSEENTHIEIKMGNGLTFFLDSKPSRWDPHYAKGDVHRHGEGQDNYRSILEFYLKTKEAVRTKYNELTSLGYRSYHAPYATSFGMYFAMINDPDGNTILLSGDLNNPEIEIKEEH